MHQAKTCAHVGDLGWANSISHHLLARAEAGAGVMPGWARLQYPPTGIDCGCRLSRGWATSDWATALIRMQQNQIWRQTL